MIVNFSDISFQQRRQIGFELSRGFAVIVLWRIYPGRRARSLEIALRSPGSPVQGCN